MKYLPLLLAVALALIAPVSSSQTIADVQADHIAANVPNEENFAIYLQRDILEYFRSEVSTEVTAVSIEMLRDAPTQSGVAYPKYYLWVEATGERGSVAKGAVRVAAIERKGFSVTTFISADEALSRPQYVSSNFPAPLISLIMYRAARP